MEHGKYIIKEVKGHEVAICFDALISHCDIGTCKDSRGKTISAGFFSVEAEPRDEDKKDVDVWVWGKSVTLNMECRKGIDEKLIKNLLRVGR